MPKLTGSLLRMFTCISSKTLIMPIAPSGAGKSTLYNKLKAYFQLPIKICSLDIIRIQLYTGDYQQAYEQSVADPEFLSKFMTLYESYLDQGTPLYLDNTNLTVARRQPYLETAKKFGYTTVGVYFSNLDENLLHQRRLLRQDKEIPESVVKKHMQELEIPDKAEFDMLVDFNVNS